MKFRSGRYRVFIFWLGCLSVVVLSFWLLLRGALTLISHDVNRIGNWISAAIHKPVTIGHLSIAGYGIPNFQMREVSILNDQRTKVLLRLPKVILGVDFLATLLSGHITLSRVRISGLDLALHRTGHDQFQLDGFDRFDLTKEDKPSDVHQFLFMLLAQKRIDLVDSKITYYKQSGEKLPSAQLNIHVRNTKSKHRIDGRLQTIDASDQALYWNINLQGYKIDQLHGTIDLLGKHIHVTPWAREFFLYDLTSHSGELAQFKLQANWDANHLTQVHGFADTIDLILQNKSGHLLKFSPFQVRGSWQANQNNWNANLTLTNFGMSRWGRFPGVAGVTGDLTLTPDSGSLQLKTPALALDLRDYFNTHWQFSQTVATADWHYQDHGWHVNVSKLMTQNDDLELDGHFKMMLPKHSSPTVDLETNLILHRAKNIGPYLPKKLLSPELIQWLHTAIEHGRGDAKILIRGPLDQFPFTRGNGIFSVKSKLHDVVLNYWPQWPKLERLNADLIFSGDKVQITAHQGRLFQVDLLPWTATIPKISKTQTILYIDADRIHTTAEHLLAFVKSTPIRTRSNQIDHLMVKGPGVLKAHLEIPLNKGPKKTQIYTKFNLDNGTINLPDRGITLERASGGLIITESGLSSDGMNAQLFNKPIKISTQKPNIFLIDYLGLRTQLVLQTEGSLFTLNDPKIQGTIFVPNSGKKVVAKFNRLSLTAQDAPSNTNFSIKRTQIPSIEFDSRNFLYDRKYLGHTRVNLVSKPWRTELNNLEVDNPDFYLTATGNWQGESGGDISTWRGMLSTRHLNKFLVLWGLPARINSRYAEIDFRLGWRGLPSDPNLNNMNGTLSFSAQNGQIIDIGSGAQTQMSFGKLLTALSVESIGRRLQLDFSDFRTQDFDFDLFEGNVVLQNGQALIRNTLIDGPVAAVNITGRIGLVDEDYDLTIQIVPHFTSSLPVIIGLAGGPLAGGVTLIANAFLGKVVQTIAANTYHMRGSWGKPKISTLSSEPLPQDKPLPSGNNQRKSCS
jgi:uncharacterized protein YhdP